MDFGAWEGQSWDAIGREAMDAWLADFAATLIRQRVRGTETHPLPEPGRVAPEAPLLAKPFRADALAKAVRGALAG